MQISYAIASSILERADAEVLMASLLKQERSWLFAHADEEVPTHLEKQWNEWTERRRGGEPVAYITGTKEFFGRPFHVTPATLIPRPATEELVEIALDIVKACGTHRFIREIDSGIAAFADVWGESAKIVADIGTGSGCIGVTIALESPDLRVIATDISPDALLVARENASALGARHLEFRFGDGLEPLSDLTEPFLIVTNPPYIPKSILLEKDVADFEPHVALFAGIDGMDVLAKIIQAAHTHAHCIGFVMECRMEQAKRLHR
jgi:release factor glutamine methyltransferase